MEPTLQSILAKVQGIDTTELTNVQAGLTDIENDLNTLISATPATPRRNDLRPSVLSVFGRPPLSTRWPSEHTCSNRSLKNRRTVI
jgi:hypothetical protein